ncbi:MAG: hypothetical protein EPN47_19655 [Acidobacteria bacterium]|nr:MAG: hypothetical protein EPN47_19655 [Acidobacteriota bacterium]
MDRRDLLRGVVAAAIPAGGLCAGADSPPLELEVIVSSVEDALAAYHGGASRMAIEVQLDQGGLTPPLTLVKSILREAPLTARVMLRLDVRSQLDFTLRGRQQLEEVKSHARALSRLSIDGLLTGYSRDGVLDLETLSGIIDAAPVMHYTIHNVIEFTKDPLAALRSLRDFQQIDRAMVTCGRGSLAERILRIPDYEAALGPKRQIVLGGLGLDMLSTLRRHSNIRTFHLGTAVRTPQAAFGKVDRAKVQEAHNLIFS